MQAKVGIITRTKDRPLLLKRAIESVLNQKYQAWCMVIVNDGGDKNLINTLVDNYKDRFHNRIQVIHNQTSLGMEAASNLGINSISSEYLTIHDDDDSWSPEFLTTTLAELEQAHKQHSRIKGIITQAQIVYEKIIDNQIIIEHTEKNELTPSIGLIYFNQMLAGNLFAPIQFLFFSEVLQAIGSFREDLPVLGDWEFNIRFLSNYDIKIIPDSLAFYHLRADSANAYKNTIIADKAQHDFYRIFIQNEWLRNEIKAGSTSYSIITNTWTQFQIINDQILALDEFVRKQSFKNKYNRFIKNIKIFINSWQTIGGFKHYFKQFYKILKNKGIVQTIYTIKTWLVVKKNLLLNPNNLPKRNSQR